MEPERPIEKLLREEARKRREEAGAPFELHPATRRLLQGEVYRELKPKGGEPGPSPSRRWMRWSWALGILVVLGLASALLVPEIYRSRPERSFAANRAAEPASTRKPAYADQDALSTDEKSAAPVSAAARDKEETMVDRMRLAGRAEEKTSAAGAAAPPPQVPDLAHNEPVATAPPAAAPAPPAAAPRSLGLEPEVLQKKKLATDTKNAGPAPAAPALAESAIPSATRRLDTVSADESRAQVKLEAAKGNSEAVAFGGGKMAVTNALTDSFKDVAKVTQKFQQVGAAPQAEEGTFRRRAVAASAVSASAVLQSFQIERSGREVRVIDNDGSVYTGYVQPSTTTLQIAAAASRPTNKESSYFLKAPSEAVPQPAITFVVTGTNVTLKVPVVFSGRIEGVATLARDASGLRTNGAVVNGISGALKQDGSAFDQSALANSRITGTATVGGGKVVSVEAVPVGK